MRLWLLIDGRSFVLGILSRCSFHCYLNYSLCISICDARFFIIARFTRRWGLHAEDNSCQAIWVWSQNWDWKSLSFGSPSGLSFALAFALWGRLKGVSLLPLTARSNFFPHARCLSLRYLYYIIEVSAIEEGKVLFSNANPYCQI